jgi:gluconolactonase
VDWAWELLAGPATITEGPAWDGAGLWFTAIAENEIRRYDPATGRVAAVYRDTGGANGLAFGPDGALYACAGTERAVVRYGPSGDRTVLANRFEGRRLNSPNDLVLDGAGHIWFTDPRYGEDQADRELDHDSVYRLAPPAGGDGPWGIRRMTFDTRRPNGLLFAADGRTLYVAESDFRPGSIRQLRAYPVGADGALGSPETLHDFGDARGVDGMRLAADGRIVACCGWELGGPGPRIALFASDGTVLEEHPVPAGRPSNCAFGGDGLGDLYVTTLDGRLYRVANSGLRGLLRPPARPPHLPGRTGG